jgi:hypothetical protein
MQSGMLFLLVLVSLLYCFRKRRGCFDQHRARFKGTDTAIDIPHTSFLDPPDCKEKSGLRPVSALMPLPRASYSSDGLQQSTSSSSHELLAVSSDPGHARRPFVSPRQFKRSMTWAAHEQRRSEVLLVRA